MKTNTLFKVALYVLAVLTMVTAAFAGTLSTDGSDNLEYNSVGVCLVDGSTAFTSIVEFTDINVSDDIFIEDRVQYRGTGTGDTYIDYSSDNLIFYAGGVRMLDLREATPDSLVFNEDGGDLDIRLEAVGQANALFVQGSDGNVGIGTSSPSATLDVVGDVEINGMLNLRSLSEVTISGGSITVTSSSHRVDTEADAASDDLTTINGGTLGDILILTSQTSARTVVVKDGTGNLLLEGDFTINANSDTITLIYSGSNWLEIARSNNN